MRESVARVTALRFPVQAELTMPGSKSHANRAIVCACLAEGTTIIRNATPCDDVVVMVENLKKMGFAIEWIDCKKGELKVVGGMQNAKCKMQNDDKTIVLDCHNAGTTLRFLVSLAAFVPGEWVITGDEHMKKRPIGDLVMALRSLGADIRGTGGCPPVTVRGGTLKGGSVSLKADVSSQFLTSLLLIAPMLNEGLKIELDGPLASSGYIDLTAQVMKDFGVQIKRELNTFFVQYSCYLPPKAAALRGRGETRYDIEGDWSAAGAWMILSELTGSSITFPNLLPDSAQSDRQLPAFILKHRKRGDITIDCSEIPDQVMNLALLAAFRHGETVITGVAYLRHKECNRLAVITRELKKAGIAIEETRDGLIIEPPPLTPPPGLAAVRQPGEGNMSLDPHDDHRMAMCFAILGLLRGNIEIKNSQCVAKSYPQFFGHLRWIESQSRPIAIVGMRGAGKSGLARRLASRLHLKTVDIDAVFESRHGVIKSYVAEHGWPAFRRVEEHLAREFLKPGIVVSLGGGATESEKTRALLKKNAIVIWIQATKEELLKRLKSGKRPSLTGLPLPDEVQKLMVERGPHYREVATIEVASKLPFSRQLPHVVKELRKLVIPSH